MRVFNGILALMFEYSDQGVMSTLERRGGTWVFPRGSYELIFSRFTGIVLRPTDGGMRRPAPEARQDMQGFARPTQVGEQARRPRLQDQPQGDRLVSGRDKSLEREEKAQRQRTNEKGRAVFEQKISLKIGDTGTLRRTPIR